MNAFLREVEEHNRDIIKEMMKREEQYHGQWFLPKKTAKAQSSPSKPSDIMLTNRFMPLPVEQSKQATVSVNKPSIKQSTQVTALPNTGSSNGSMFFDTKPERNSILSHRNKITHTRPGNSSYSNITSRGRRVMIVGDSMVKWVKGKKVSEKLENGMAFVKSYSGATAKELKQFHAQPLLEKGGIDVAVIHVGTNSIPSQSYWVNGDKIVREESAQEIADGIVELATECRQKGVNNIFINGIVLRSETKRNARYIFANNIKIDKTNDILRRKCIENKFIFICNDFLDETYIAADGVHFNEMGSIAYTNNLVSSINHHYENV